MSLELLSSWGPSVILGLALGILLAVALTFAGLFVAGSVYALAVGVKRAVKGLAYRIRPRRRKSARVKN